MKNTFELKYHNHDLQETWKFVNETCTVHKLSFLEKTDLCLPLPQRFEKKTKPVTHHLFL